MEIDAAHYLPRHPGKCKNLHGHRWKITVEIRANALDELDMVIDFSDITKIIKRFDHTNLNTVIDANTGSPTAEIIAMVIADEIKEKLGSMLHMSRAIITRVIVEESPVSVIEYTP